MNAFSPEVIGLCRLSPFSFFRFLLVRPLQLSPRNSRPTLAPFAFQRLQRVFVCLSSTSDGSKGELSGFEREKKGEQCPAVVTTTRPSSTTMKPFF